VRPETVKSGEMGAEAARNDAGNEPNALKWAVSASNQ